MSSTGQYQTAVINGGGLYYNSTFGIGTWTLSASAPNNTSITWRSVTLSSSGQYQTAVVSGGGLYTNNSYGTGTWTISTSAPSTTWNSVALSTTGQYQIASNVAGGSIYNSVTNFPTFWCDGLIVNGSTKSFIIDHPIDLSRYLVHACVEGPEIGVYYRGEGTVTNDESVNITLPDYVKYIAYDYTVQITPTTATLYSTSEVDNGTGVFTVYGKNGSFYWSVYGTRGPILVDPRRESTCVKGDGPYKYIV